MKLLLQPQLLQLHLLKVISLLPVLLQTLLQLQLMMKKLPLLQKLLPQLLKKLRKMLKNVQQLLLQQHKPK